MVCVADLVADELAEVRPQDLGRIDSRAAHRLGPITESGPLAQAAERPDRGLHVYVARYAVANLRFPEPAGSRLGGGRSNDPALAELMARAEAAERYASGDLAPHELSRASEIDLDAPFVSPHQVYRANARQQREREDALIPYEPSAEHLWIAGEAPTGDRRWVPADAVFYPFFDPLLGGRTLATSSSGSAAHTTLDEARRRALYELVERDAFMWTWVQRVERELIDERSLPRDLRDRAAGVAAGDLSIAFVNLTLDLLPVVACVIHSTKRLSVTLACSPDPAEAVERALNEGLGLLETIERGRLEKVDPREVRTPEQHAALYVDDPSRSERNRFLYASTDRVALQSIGHPDADPVELVASVGDPITVDLSSPATAPFHVARVVVPGIVPVSFGYDREPLGMPRLAEPKRSHDGRLLGGHLDLAEAGPLDPHPFA